MGKKRVLLSLPRCGQVEPESRFSGLGGGWHGDHFHVFTLDNSNSALTWNFNNAWCEFLNGDYAYFGMLHSDIAVSGPWINALADALNERDAGIAHMVMAIKDERGLTSTAIGDPGDPWRPVRRITANELMGLPLVFDVHDLSYLQYRGERCLLPNTGCMLVKRGDWCEKFPGFEIRNRLIEVDGKRHAQFEPEDWNFGRWAANNGVRVIGSRQCETTHFGRFGFKNNYSWGAWKFDEDARGEM